MIFTDNGATIGNTPLVTLKKINQGNANILGKIEGRNPAFSIKDRVGLAMINDAEQRGRITKGTTIIEPTSGNTGIALAFICAQRDYPCHIVMPETMSLERRKVIAMLGAKLILTPGDQGMKGAISYAENVVANNPTAFFMPQQFTNPANVKAHEETTGPEIWEACAGDVDVLVCGVGTGGTISGISHYIKKTKKHPLVSVAVEPEGSPVITQYRAGQPLQPGSHAIQGIGAGFIPKTLDVDCIDSVCTVSNADAINFARKLAKEEGILAGISSGAAACCACRLSLLPEFAGKTIVCILPDAGERYLSSALFDNIA
ncbi:MAG: cysteine synthase A [Desulfovibrio sp.]|nr:cysteine synthase A [Desulfovibrio sp.]